MRLKSVHGKSTLASAFDIKPSELVAIVGGGGKTNMMFLLAEEWNGLVVSTTTTRIFAQQRKLAPYTCLLNDPSKLSDSEEATILNALNKFQHILVIGDLQGDKAHGVSPDLPENFLALDGVSLVLVEADGSRMKPIKAPAEHEPVIPKATSLVVPMAGIEAVGRPIHEIAHRPERLSKILGLAEESDLSAEDLGRMFRHKEGGLKRAPNAAKVVPYP